MAVNNYTVYWENGDRKDFVAPGILVAFIRALSYTLSTSKKTDISHIIDEESGKIYYAWDWDVTWSEQDKTFNPVHTKRYSEEEVFDLITGYGNSLGTYISSVEYFEEHRKK